MKDSLFEKIIKYLCIILFVLFTLGPLIWCFVITITPEYEMLKNTTSFLPSEIYWGNYKEIFDVTIKSHEVLFGGLMNSLKMALLSIFIGIPTAVLAGYAFYRYKFFAKNFIIKFLMITIVIPVFTTIIPIYATFARFGFLDKLFYVSIIYVSSFIPITTWIIMNYFKTLPKELLEAAEVEGLNERQIFFHVILPISYPIILTCVLMVFIMSWNQFQIPLILLSSPENKVVTLILSEFMGRNDISYGLIALCGLVSLVIPAIVAIIFRNKLISGLTQGSVKG